MASSLQGPTWFFDGAFIGLFSLVLAGGLCLVLAGPTFCRHFCRITKTLTILTRKRQTGVTSWSVPATSLERVAMRSATPLRWARKMVLP